MATRFTMHWKLFFEIIIVCVLKVHLCDAFTYTPPTTATPLTTTTYDWRTTSAPKDESPSHLYHTDCGFTKGCFTNCQSGPCDFMVTWQTTPTGDLHFSMQTMRYRYLYNAYIAIAFSDDYRMGDDSVVACYRYNVAEHSFNDGTNNHPFNLTKPWITGVHINNVSPRMYCSFTRKINATNNSRFFDLNNDYYIMLVTGKLGQPMDGFSPVRRKLLKHEDLPWMSDSKVDFQSNQIVGPYKLFSPLVKLHGIVMVLAWVLFSWLGIMTIRYNKDMYPDKKLFGTAVWWLQVHRILMVAVLLCVVVGFIAIFVEIGGYSQVTPDEKRYMGAHPVLGIIITVLVVLNPIGAIFRPDGDHKFRWIFNWGHLGIGVVAQLLAVITIFIGYFSTRTDLSHAPAYVTAFHLFVIIFVSVFLEVRKRTVVGRQDVGAANYYGGVNADVTSKLTTKQMEEMPKPDRDPFIVLVVFFFITFGVALALLFIIYDSTW